MVTLKNIFKFKFRDPQIDQCHAKSIVDPQKNHINTETKYFFLFSI